ncbi:MAG: amidophosphoribosyltransferase, partial [Schleiferiaceae bacterium]|nr:amidophosphoribosyltransferase [Schleiferiaceae bacterium]
LVKKRKLDQVLPEAYELAKSELKKPKEKQINAVKAVYSHFSADEISDEIAVILTPKHVKAEVKIIYQRIEDLHASCPQNLGDWYFTGNYPTPGGTRVANQSFVNYMEGNNQRAY